MQIAALEIDSLRILSKVRVDLAPGGNLFKGVNGAGKTAVLEAVHLLATGRSFRPGGPRGLIRHGESGLRIRVRLDSGLWLALERSTSGGFRGRRGSDAVRRMSDLARELPVQLLLPDAAELVFGGPGERRSALDWGLFHVEHGFQALSREYTQSLKQRNALLRRSQLSGTRPDKELSVWTHKVAEAGEQLTQMRLDYVERLSGQFAATLHSLSPELNLTIDYQPGHSPEQLLVQLEEDTLRELKLGTTKFGPHRADLRIRLMDRLAGSVLSRGQGKIAAFSMRLAQAKDLRDQAGIAPVFLVDDLGAELDRPHNERLFQVLRDLDSQVLATTAMDQLSWGEDWQLFHVEQGSVTSRSGLSSQ